MNNPTLIVARRPILLFVILAGLLLPACSNPTPIINKSIQGNREVTIYVSTDRVFSEPILIEYEKQSGVKVNAVYDTEETKSTGLANKLLAEKDRPHADVFWSNEPVRTLVLKKNGILSPYKSPNADGISADFKDAEG